VLRTFLALTLLCGVAACSSLPSGPERPVFTETGLASWYGRHHAGRRTASGERFDINGMTAAHRSLAFNTVMRVTDLGTGKVVKVRVNDRGPYVKGRIIDLSAAAATALGIAEDGVAEVRLEVYASDQPQSASR
jgi:rare lipoprotein A